MSENVTMYFDKEIHNYSRQKNRRKDLRNNLTAAEAALWILLKGGQLHGRKFRRQHGIEKFVVDFYCASERLIIELDGAFHNDSLRMEYDKVREDRLKELGFKILRIENRLVFDHTEDVLRLIVSSFKQLES